MLRSITSLAAAASFCGSLLVLHGCSQQPSATGPIRIGVIAPFHTTPGDGIRHGVEMAVTEINAAGGVLGRQLQIVAVDDEFSTEKATSAYQRLAGSDGVVAAIGVAGSGIFPIMEQLARYKTPMIATGVSADRLTEMVREDPARYGWFFRVMHRSSELASLTSDFLAESLYGRERFRKFAIVAEDDVWTKALRDEWKRRIASLPDARVVYEATFSPETTDFAPIFTAIQRTGADYILDASSRVPASTYLKRWADMKGPMIGAVPTGAGTRKYYEEVGAAGTAVCSVGTIPSPHNPVSERAGAWWSSYLKRFGEPEYTSAYSYDAVYAVKQAIERAGSTDPSALRNSLEQVDLAGVTGRIAFDESHQARYGTGYRVLNMLQYQVPDDAYGYRVVWPFDRASAQLIRPLWLSPSR